MMTASGPSETLNSPTAEIELASARMMQFITGSFVSQVVRTFAELTIADLLAQQPATALEIATATGAHAEATMRLLRAGHCARLGYNRPVRLASFQRQCCGRCSPKTPQDHYAAWRSPLHHQVPGFPREKPRRLLCRSGGRDQWSVHGMEYFEYLVRHPVEAEIFTAAMDGVTGSLAEQAARIIETQSGCQWPPT